VKLKRAFSELIENSVDFQPHGGQLTIRTSPADRKLMGELTRQQFTGEVIQVDFIDQGPGLTEQDRARVFTPFYTRKAKGMGLGLSIVKGIIEAHGGMIREIGDLNAEKGRGAGAHFIVFLPVNSAPDGEKKETDNTAAAPQANAQAQPEE
jgi:signal transduction histidine kinase